MEVVKVKAYILYRTVCEPTKPFCRGYYRDVCFWVAYDALAPTFRRRDGHLLAVVCSEVFMMTPGRITRMARAFRKNRVTPVLFDLYFGMSISVVIFNRDGVISASHGIQDTTSSVSLSGAQAQGVNAYGVLSRLR